MLVAEDVKGSVAAIATILAEHEINIATCDSRERSAAAMHSWSSRSTRSPAKRVRDEIRALPWVRWAFRLDKVSA